MSHYTLTDDEPLVGSNSDAAMIEESVIMFTGKQLEPFNARRLFAANALGMRVFRLSAEEQASIQAGDASSYNGSFFDIALVLFLCSHPLSTSFRAIRLPAQVQEECLAWAEKKGIVPGSDTFVEAAEAFANLLTPIFKNDANQELPPGDGDGPAKKKRSRK